MAHAPGPYPLLCRLADRGTAVEIDLGALFPHIQRACQAAGRKPGVAVVVVCCCGDFPPVHPATTQPAQPRGRTVMVEGRQGRQVEGCAVPVVFPGRVMPAVARALCRAGPGGARPRVGVVSPIPGQIAEAERHWSAPRLARPLRTQMSTPTPEATRAALCAKHH